MTTETRLDVDAATAFMLLDEAIEAAGLDGVQTSHLRMLAMDARAASLANVQRAQLAGMHLAHNGADTRRLFSSPTKRRSTT